MTGDVLLLALVWSGRVLFCVLSAVLAGWYLHGCFTNDSGTSLYSC